MIFFKVFPTSGLHCKTYQVGGFRMFIPLLFGSLLGSYTSGGCYNAECIPEEMKYEVLWSHVLHSFAFASKKASGRKPSVGR